MKLIQNHETCHAVHFHAQHYTVSAYNNNNKGIVQSIVQACRLKRYVQSCASTFVNPKEQIKRIDKE